MARLLTWAGASTVVILCTLTAAKVVRPPTMVTWNATPSVPIGLYFVSRQASRRGDLVLVDLPPAVRVLAAERRYLPLGVHLAKRIAAVSGDEICAKDHTIYINGAAVAERQERDQAGREMPSWAGCQTLADEVFLLLPKVPTSFDGRYFGAVPASAVIGKMTPVWTQ